MATDNTKPTAGAGQIPGNPPTNVEGYSVQNPPKSSDTPTTVYNDVPPIYTPKEPGFVPEIEPPVGGVIFKTTRSNTTPTATP